MSGLPDLEELINKLEAATEEAREVTRELHSTLKAARVAERELVDRTAEARTELPKVMERALGEMIASGLAEYAESLRAAMKSATKMVQETFERQTNMCLFGNEQGRGVNILEEIGAHLQRGRDNLNRESRGGGLNRWGELPDLHRGPR